MFPQSSLRIVAIGAACLCIVSATLACAGAAQDERLVVSWACDVTTLIGESGMVAVLVHAQ